MGEHRLANRQPAILRRCSLGLLSLKRLEMTDHVVRIVDISRGGVGVESDEQMEPGLVWFYTSVEDHRGGILLWSRKQDDHYRAGIRFLTFSAEDERLLRNWPPCPSPLRPCVDIEEFITAWMRADRAKDHQESDLVLQVLEDGSGQK